MELQSDRPFNTYGGREYPNRLREDSAWAKIDIFELRYITSPLVLKIFYILFLVTMLLLLASVILLLVPRTTSENPNAASMESAITNWKYSKSNDAFFRNAQMHFYFMDTGMNPLRDLSDRALKFTYDVKYVDGYVPTNYVDKTHISELTTNSDHIPPAFSFNNESKPTTLQWCIETNFEYNGVSKNASGPQCNGRGLSVRPLKASVVDYAYRCSIVGPEKCKKECAATRGVFRDNTCMSVSVARAICLKAQIEKDKLSITGGCQNNSQPEIYQNLEPGQNYSFTKIAFMLKDQDDPYIRAHGLPVENQEPFFNMNNETKATKAIKVLVSVAGIILLALFFIFFIMRIVNEDEIIKKDLKDKRASLTKYF